ncbi:MAG: putative peptidyl-prolyl cis-trans isomerase [Candidatus Scalindua rubra]|uniref:Putative peptidyl-prolyl cis-trans isomerase n=1 Tax=Candidatus Scalindua rubra TaxID=1872076 RepID=A0A1E3XE61_9BACT|nr:MAG: putative peptidyl-prolyl cis-trans isomerase [Candidatus Scalindua rubra]
MNAKLNLTVPKPDKRSTQRQSKLLPVFMAALLIIIISAVILIYKKIDNIKTNPAGTALSPENIKDMALKLEKQGLNEISALTWKEYINTASLDNIDAANIWYRIGKLYQQDNEYAKAIESYYRSESYAKIQEIETEISRRIQECFESLGKFAALQYELDNRVSINKSKDEVVAEIGNQKITKSDLDQKIETTIEQQLLQLASYLPVEERNKQKEKMLKQFSSSSQKMNFLNQIILEEVFYRKAREENLMNDKNIRDLLKAQEKSFLARKFFEKELSEKINITESDLKNYYAAHKDDYIQPERVKISHILVSNDEDALKVREKLKDETFENVAKEMSLDKVTSEEGGEIKSWIENNGVTYIPGFGNSADAKKIIFETKSGKIADKDIKTDKGVHIIKVREYEDKTQRNFEEVAQEVYQSLRSEKEREIHTQLLNELKDRYDVVIHHALFAEKENNEQD